jgi:hypothetical protein
MTMQVGMVGSDGIVLGSDTKWMVTESVRHTFNSPKIKVDYARGVAIACARNMETSTLIADRILAKLEDKDLEYPHIPMESIARKAVKRGARNDVQLLIALSGQAPRLFQLTPGSVGGVKGFVCRTMNSTAVTGDDVNAAVFWLERYYERRPIRSLVPLAAHVVVSASKLNNCD